MNKQLARRQKDMVQNRRLMKKIGNTGYMAVLIIAAAVPLGVGIVHGIHFFAPMMYKKYMAVIAFLCFICLGSFLFILEGKNIRKDQKTVFLLIPVFIFTVSFTVKCFLAYAEGCDIFQNSEYGIVLRIASGLESNKDLGHISVFPHWSLAGILNGMFCRIFHNASAYLVCEYVNAFLLSAASVLMYFIGRCCFKSTKGAVLGSLLFALAPTENLYFLMLSNEFWAIAGIALFAFFAVHTNMFLSITDVYGRSMGLVILIAGISLFIIKYSKPVGIVFFAAIVICWVYAFFTGLYSSEIKRFTQAAVSFVIIALTGVILSNIYCTLLRNKTGVPINDNQSPHFLFIGIDPYYDKVGNIYEEKIIESDYDYDSVNKEYMNTIISDLRENPSYLPGRLLKNFKLQWEDYGNGVRMALYRFQETGNGKSFINLTGTDIWLKPLTQLFYLLTLFFAFISVMFRIFVRSSFLRKKYSALEGWREMNYLFIVLCIVGVAFGLTIGEAQERYKCVVMPFVYLLAGDGICSCWMILDNSFFHVYLTIKSGRKSGK